MLYVRVFVSFFVTVCGVRGRNNRIVGGQETFAHDYPWLVGIAFGGALKCGGSLISHSHVLTAAHCVQYAEANEFRVSMSVAWKRMGDHPVVVVSN